MPPGIEADDGLLNDAHDLAGRVMTRLNCDSLDVSLPAEKAAKQGISAVTSLQVRHAGTARW